LNPAQLSLALGRVQQLFASGQAGQAEQLARQLLASYPSSPAVLNVLALVLKGRGALEEAEDVMRRALALAPRDAALHNNLGNILRQRGDLAGSEKSYRRAIALAHDYAEAFFNLGVVLAELGRKEEALAAHRRAVAIRPAHAGALTQIGVLLGDTGQNEDALAAFDAALRAEPNGAAAHYGRGIALTALDRPDEAVEALTCAAKANPLSHETQFALGNALVGAGRDAEALPAYRRAAELAPHFLPAHRAHAMLAASMGKPDSAGETFIAARAKLGDDPELLLAEAALRLRLDDAVAAEDLARRAGSRPDAGILLAQSLTAQRRFEDSIAILEGTTGYEPLVVCRELAIALLRSGQPARAVEVLEAGRRLAPTDQLILAHLSLAYREAGQGAYADLVDLDQYVRIYDVPVEGLAPVLERLHTSKAAPLDQTLRGGTQTAGALFANKAPEIAALREAIRDRVADYIQSLPDDPGHPVASRKAKDFAFVGSWSCLLKSSGYHTNHVHQQGWISSACYIALPEAVRHGDQGWLKFGESNLALGPRDVPARSEQPTVGKLVLFPSYYWHGTVPFTDTAARLTVAFDVAPR
jgi:tetratricopeptide (TPR) repeat protein